MTEVIYWTTQRLFYSFLNFPTFSQDKKKKMPTTVLSRVFQRDYKKMKLPDTDEEDSEDERVRSSDT